MKPLGYLVLSRIWDRERCLLFCFIILVAIILIYNFAKVDCFLKGIDLTILTVWENSKIIYDIALSCLGGIIIYFLTVVLVETKRSKFILVETESILKCLEDAFMDLSLDMDLGDINNVEVFTERGLNTVKNHGRASESHYCLTYCSIRIYRLAREFEALTNSILQYSTILTQQELSLLIHIRQSKTASRLKNRYGVNHLLTECEVLDYFKGIAELYREVCNLRSLLSNRIYKR